jgi:transposase
VSRHPQPIPPVPEEAARVARTAFPHGNLSLMMRDELGTLFTNDDFAALFPRRGQPAEAPWRLALVTIMPDVEEVSDRQAAEAMRGRIDWKYALSVELTDPGFDRTVLSEFRTRLVMGQAEQLRLETWLSQLRARGLLKARGRQRTDSTHVLAALRVLNRLELVGETLRHALHSLAVVAPDWLRVHVPPEGFDRYGTRVENSHLPHTTAARAALAATIGADGRRLLQAVETATDLPWLQQVPAVQTRRQVWAEPDTDPPGPLRWREVKERVASAGLIASPADPEARYCTKRGVEGVGDKVHLTETGDDGQPPRITQVRTTPATTPDGVVGPPHPPTLGDA